MDFVVGNGKERTVVNVESLMRNSERIDEEFIAPANRQTTCEIYEDHSAQPIKSMEDIMRISSFFIDNKRWRDNMLFIVGINFGLRVSDLVELRFNNIINDDYTFKDTFPVFEKKTRNTRKRKKNRYITINKAVKEAVLLYLENTKKENDQKVGKKKFEVSLSDYMFRGFGSVVRGEDRHITPRQVNNLLKEVSYELGLQMRMSSHSLRKTFCFHQMRMSRNDPRKLLLLQKMLGHSTSAQTLDYIGLTDEEMFDAYKNLNLGSEDYNYLVDTNFYESDEAPHDLSLFA